MKHAIIVRQPVIVMILILISNINILTITYYDNYDFFNITGNPVGNNLKSEVYDVGVYNILSKLASGNKGR